MQDWSFQGPSSMRLIRIKTAYCKPRTTIANHARHKYPYLLRKFAILRANHIWVIDILYISVKKGYIYLFTIIYLYAMYIVEWSLPNTMTSEWVVKAIKVELKREERRK